MKKPKEPILNNYAFQYTVKGIRTLIPLVHHCKGKDVETAAHDACEELRVKWTNKLGGNLDNPKTVAIITVAYDPNIDKKRNKAKKEKEKQSKIIDYQI